MRILILVLALAAAVFLFSAPVIAQDTPGEPAGDAEGDKGKKDGNVSTSPQVDMKELKASLSFLNLLNGLHLTQPQFEKLIDVNRKLKKTMDENEDKFGKIAEEEKAVLIELEKVVRENKPIPKRLRQKVHAAEGRTKKAQRMLDEVTVQCSSAVEEVFTQEQQEVIKDFEPCTIPPKNLSDPVRVGQASDSERAVALMRRIRQMPRPFFEANLNKIADRHMKHLCERKRLSEQEQQEERQRLKEFLWKVHNMDEVQFEMHKDELAGEYRWNDRAKELHKELGELSRVRHPRRHKGKAARYFLDVKIIPVLEERLEKLRGDEGGLKGKRRSKAKRSRK